MSQPTLDVLIVSYNTRDELTQTIATLLQHAPSPPLQLRVHVLDNGSSDGSPAAVKERFPEVDLVSSDTNLGFGRAMNALARRSDGEYLMLLNSDVIVERDICTPLVEALAADPRVVVTSPRLRSPNGMPQFSANRLPTLRSELALAIKGSRLGRALRPLFDSERIVNDDRQIAPALGLHAPWPSESIWATCWVLRRSDFPDGQVFDERFPLYDEDLDFCFRMRARDRTLLYLPQVELTHLGGASSTEAQKSVAMARGRRQYYRLHGGPLHAAAYRWLITGFVPWLVDRVAAIPKPSAARR